MKAGVAKWLATTVVAISLAASGCQTQPSPTGSTRPTPNPSCQALAGQIVDAVQDYVDSFAEVSADEIGGAVSARQGDFASTTRKLRERGQELGCDPAELADMVRGDLGRLTGGTPVQDAIADTFRADPLGTVDPSDTGPAEIEVETAEQLVAAVANAGSGSTIRLAPGTFKLSTPLVALRPITLVGTGDGSDPARASEITSNAAGATLIAATSGNLVLSDLALSHTGNRAASVVIVAGGGYRMERVRVSGGASEKDAGGYGIVLRPTANPLTPTGDERSLTDVTITDNDEGGIVIAGSEQPTVTRARVTGSSGCGLCWVEQAGGSASDSLIQDVQIGVRVDDSASPTIVRNRVVDADAGVALTGSGSPRLSDCVLSGATIGVQATGTGSATLTDLSVAGAKEIGIRMSGTTRTTLERNLVSGATKVGIATVGRAHSVIIGGRVTTTGDVGVLWAEGATGSASDAQIRGPKLGIQLAGTAAVDLSDLVADKSATAALLASGRTTGTITGLACGEGDSALVVLTDSSAVRLASSPTCRTHRQ